MPIDYNQHKLFYTRFSREVCTENDTFIFIATRSCARYHIQTPMNRSCILGQNANPDLIPDPGFWCIHILWKFKIKQDRPVKTNVLDPWHFWTDQEPLIRRLDYWSGSCSFREWLSRCQQKLSFKFFAYYYLTYSRLPCRTLASVFKDN